MPHLETWNSKWIAYVKQYAGVPKFNSTVTDIRNLKIEPDLDACDKFNVLMDQYNAICFELHELSKNPNDLRYQRIQQEERVKAGQITVDYTNWIGEAGTAIGKLAKAFKFIQANEKYLTQNRRPAADLVNAIKGIDASLSHQKTMLAAKNINITLDETRRDPSPAVIRGN